MNEELIRFINAIKDRWGSETVAAIRRRIQELNLVDTGTLERSVIYEQDENSGDINFFMADYGTFQDLGVNGLDFNWESPYQFRGNYHGTAFAIQEWANTKGLNAWATARSIQSRGIEPKRFFNTVIEQRLQVLGDDITSGIADYMNRQVQVYQNRQQNP